MFRIEYSPFLHWKRALVGAGFFFVAVALLSTYIYFQIGNEEQARAVGNKLMVRTIDKTFLKTVIDRYEAKQKRFDDLVVKPVVTVDPSL